MKLFDRRFFYSLGTIFAGIALLLFSGFGLAGDEPVPPDITVENVASSLAIPLPEPYIPDIPWHAPLPRTDAKTPFAPKFLKGNNIFTGEKEFWLANAVAATEGSRPGKFSEVSVCDYLTALTRNIGLYSHEPNKTYSITVINSPYQDAFTAGGGQIFITRGMLKQVQSEDELAGIIAHEIGHDNFHHAGRSTTRQLYWALGITEVKSYDETKRALAKLIEATNPEKNPFPALGEAVSGIHRADELAADKAAFYFLYRAGYNPKALATYFHREPDVTLAYLKEELGGGWPVFWTISLLFDSHPPHGFRAVALDWESNFVDITSTDNHVDVVAFQAMKNRLRYLDSLEAEKARVAGAKAEAGRKKAHPEGQK